MTMTSRPAQRCQRSRHTVHKQGSGDPEDYDFRLVTDYTPKNPYIERLVRQLPLPNIVF